MTPYEELLSEGYLHNIQLAGNRERLQRDVKRIAQAAETRLQQRLVNSAMLLSEADINRVRRGVFGQTERLRAFSRRLDSVTGEVAQEMRDAVLAAARDLAMYEAMFWQDRYRQLVADEPDLAPIINTDAALTRAATSAVSRDVVVSGTIAATIAAYLSNRRRQLRTQITAAAQANGLSGVVDLLDVRPGSRRVGRVIGGTTRAIAGIAGDIHTHATAVGAKTFTDSNPRFDLVWTSIIDERTSSICLTRNGQFVNRDLDGLVPPAHINCRSIVVPVILSERLTNEQRSRLRRPVRRAIERGLPNFNSTQESFDGLSEFRQRQLLGPVRFRIFQQEGLNVRDFIQGERLISLDDLARREGLNLGDFRRAA